MRAYVESVVLKMNYQHQDILMLNAKVEDLAKVPEGAMPNHKMIVDVLMESSQLLQQKGWNKFSMARIRAAKAWV